MRFQFGLQSVLALRQRETDLHQQSVMKARAHLEAQIRDLENLAKLRRATIDELRMMNDGGSCEVGQVIDRLRHAGQLNEELALAEAMVRTAEADLDLRRHKLLAAKQSVQALEKLAERQFVQHQKSLARSAARG